MKISKSAPITLIASMFVVEILGGPSFGQDNQIAVPQYYKASHYNFQDSSSNQAPTTVAPVNDSMPETTASPYGDAAPAGEDGGISSCGCEGRCNLGEPFKLIQNPVAGFNIGGWTSMGYHSAINPFSFNTYDNRVQLGQQWFYAEKVADGSEGTGFGGRIDYVYGTDAPDTQAFGAPGSWDNNWDNGAQYGHAIPQLYGEVAAGDLSVKAGHFFTIVGNEVVQATGNFFYSRQFTFYNSEPFTHSGALATYSLDEDTQFYGGYVLGWDSAFDDNGDTYLSGFKRKLSDDVSLLYSAAVGRFGDRTAAQERGSVNSAILTASLTDNLTFINQSDVLFTRDLTGIAQRNTFGNISYLILKMNDCVSLGQRLEWFNYGGQGFGGRSNDDLYNYTLGLNYKQSANLMFRPEVRWVWDREQFGFNENNSSSQASFGGDMVLTF